MTAQSMPVKVPVIRELSESLPLTLTPFADLRPDSWAVRELASKLFTAHSEERLHAHDYMAAESSLLAAQEALIPGESSAESISCQHPVQHAAIQLLLARVALSRSEERCKPVAATRFSCVLRSGHQCSGRATRPRVSQKARRATKENKAACSWKQLLQKHLWDLLACVDAVQSVPLLFRYRSHLGPCSPPLHGYMHSV